MKSTSEIGGRKLAGKPRTARDLAADWKRWSSVERTIAMGIAALWVGTISSLVILIGL